MKSTIYEKYIKRLLDVVLSLAGMVVLVPLFCVIAVAVWADQPGEPVLFRQERYGRHRQPFTMIKFRTMTVDDRGEPSVTGVGRFLRRTSLDELPQLWHILRGEMSLVGPRPLIFAEGDVIAEREKYNANALRPGLTGWAQIHGRNTLNVQEKAKYDGEYAKHVSFMLDCRCLFLTIGKVIRQEDIGDM